MFSKGGVENMDETLKVKYEVYDDRNPNVVLFSHKSSYVCTRYIDNERETKGEHLGEHLWFRTVPDNEE